MIMWGALIAGFGTNIPDFTQRFPSPPRIIYLHSAVFTMWMLLLTAQVFLVLRDRVAWHRTLGWFAAAWSVVMVVVGVWTAFTFEALNLKRPHAFLIVQFVALGAFVALLAWAVLLRRNPAAHRRLAMLSSVALMSPGFSRLLFFVAHQILPNPRNAWLSFSYEYYGDVLLIALMLFWDWRKGRLVRSFLIGSTALVAAELAASFMLFWQPWRSLADSLVLAWARLTS